MIHHVFANRSNIGDWLSALGIQSLLAPHPVTDHLCDEPFVESTLAELAKLDAEDFVVIGGGGLFMDYFTPFWEGFLPLADKVPFAIWGVGYCDLKREPSHVASELLQAIVGKSQLCIVRDELTRKYLSVSDLSAPVICPSVVIIEKEALRLGVLHVDNYTTAGAEVYDVMDTLAREFACNTHRAFSASNNRIAPGNKGEMNEILKRYAYSDIILSSALHGCIIGLAMGRKVLAVSGDRKIEAFMEALGLGEWVCDIANVDTILERLFELESQPAVGDAIAQAISENREVASQIKTLAGLSRV